MIEQQDLDMILMEHPDLGINGYPDELACRGHQTTEEAQEALRGQLEGVQAVVKWLYGCGQGRTWGRSTYGLKHVMSHDTGVYVSNGEFIAAVLHIGLPYKIYPGSPNPLLRVRPPTGSDGL